MGVFVKCMEMPSNCLECQFISKLEEIPVGEFLYKKIGHCVFAPDSIEDPWRDVTWLMRYKEDYCPLVHLGNRRDYNVKT